MTQSTRVWNPWRELSRMQREMSDAFAVPRLLVGDVNSSGVLNVYQGEKGVLVTASLPGLNVDELELTVTGELLTLKGAFHREPVDEGVNWQRRERHLEPFDRTVVLPFEVDPATAEAVYENGVLTVTASRPAHQQPKKIQLKANR